MSHDADTNESCHTCEAIFIEQDTVGKDVSSPFISTSCFAKSPVICQREVFPQLRLVNEQGTVGTDVSSL